MYAAAINKSDLLQHFSGFHYCNYMLSLGLKVTTFKYACGTGYTKIYKMQGTHISLC